MPWMATLTGHVRQASRSGRLIRSGLVSAVCLGMVAAGCGGDGHRMAEHPSVSGQSGSSGISVLPDDNSGSRLPGSPTVLQWEYPAAPVSADWYWQLPAHVKPPRVPIDNPMSVAKVELGRHLFYEKRLSRDASMSCASCHVQSRAFADGKERPAGVTGQRHPRNSMGLSNIAWNATQTWANPAILSLERQIPVPVFGDEPVEMGVNNHVVDMILERLRMASEIDYPEMFREAFPGAVGETLSWEHIFKAISAFQRTLVSFGSRYDRYLAGELVLSPQERNGLKLFESAQCVICHQPPHFTDQVVDASTQRLTVRYHNVGLYNLDGKGAYPSPNTGAADITANQADMGAFRVPSLRNVEVTGPYMHDGSVATLEESVDILVSGGRNITSGVNRGDGRKNPYKSDLVRDRGLSDQDKADLVAFLKTLTDERFLNDPAFSDPFAAGKRTVR